MAEGSGLLDHRGQPIQSTYKKASPPKLGEAFGSRWDSNSAMSIAQMPGGGILQFNLDRLTLSDFRMMRDHYQVNASLSVLTFMIHQLDWKIECDNERIRKHVQDNMDRIWTQLVRAIGQAFWSGYSPSILQWDNDLTGRTVQLTKVKDLRPEECAVHWKLVDGWAPPDFPNKPKIRVYDGIDQIGMSWPVPTENTFWYPLLMENGDWYGRKLLRPAFTSWFFSILIHLFSNRYFERFGEPMPVGRAPYDDEIDINGKKVAGRDVMLGILQNFRSRGVVVLPSERSVVGNNVDYDYQIEYLESQMRGADFERYLTRLDEEISLALFTPLLMLRTADVGSYNLGTTHAQVYFQMLNALAGDMKQYIDKYIISRMVDYNFGLNAPRATIKFRKLGDEKSEMVVSLLQQLVAAGAAKPDLKELGEIAGLSLEEVEVITSDPNQDPNADPNADPNSKEDPAGKNADPKSKDGKGKASDSKGGSSGGGSSKASGRAAEAMYERLEAQFSKAFREGTFGNGFEPSVGFRRQFEDGLRSEGVTPERAARAYAIAEAIVADVATLGSDAFPSVEDVMRVVKHGITAAIGDAQNATNQE